VVGTAGDMGKGEMVKAVRFIGPRGYVVTFRQTDPLYVLDLAEPAHPKVVGELKVPGYSAYLHPVGENLLLGVGQDATEQGRTLGTKVALYDVSNPAKPAELDGKVVPASVSAVERDSRAFLWWAPTRLAVVPIQSGGGLAGAVGYRVGDRDVGEVGQIRLEGDRGWNTALRSVVIGDSVHTIGTHGVRTSTLDRLEDRGWLPL
jgi:uncharacterized secreted protein with C-terminal beta-propeller domain